MTPRDRATTLFAFAYDSGKLMRDIRMLICSGVHVGKMIADANSKYNVVDFGLTRTLGGSN